MRKFLGFTAACAIILFGFLSIRALPIETDAYIAKKYAGYAGVIRCWICADFSCAGSFNGWLNSCAAAFERAHEGVYIEIETVSESVMAARHEAMLPPDMIFYSPSTADSRNLTGVTLLAMGGYTAVTRSGAPFDPATCAVGRESHRDSAAAAILTGADAATPIEEIGIDLGLPAGTGASMTADQALALFIDGGADSVMATSRMLSQLINRRERGLPPDWTCASPAAPFTDQLLLGAACCTGEKESICRALLRHLTARESQQALAKIGAISPIMRIYPDASPYAAMDAAMHRTDRIRPRIDASAQIDCVDILQHLRSGAVDIAAARALVRERYNCASANAPI